MNDSVKRKLLLFSTFLVLGIFFVGGFLLLPIFQKGDLPPFSAETKKVQGLQVNPKHFKEIKDPSPTPEDEQAVLIAVGDIMPSRVVGQKMRQYKDYHYPFANMKKFLQSGDIVFGNLESSITPGREIKTGEFMFRSDPEVAQAMRDAGFTIVSLANNHTPNFGVKGLLDTFRYLEEAGIKYIGAGENDAKARQPAFFESSSLTFAFLAYNDTDVVPKSYGVQENSPGTVFMDIEKMRHDVMKAKESADFVIVSMHSGTEYVQYPNLSQKNFARAAIDAGGELILGHHPHVVQTMEKYKGKYIFYSLGNFVFDQMWSRDTREGLAIKIFFDRNGAQKIEYMPVLIEDYAQPRPLEGSEAEKIFKRLENPEIIFTQPYGSLPWGWALLNNN